MILTTSLISFPTLSAGVLIPCDASWRLVARSSISFSPGPLVLSSLDSWLRLNLSKSVRAWESAATCVSETNVKRFLCGVIEKNVP